MKQYIKNLVLNAGLIIARPVVDGKQVRNRVVFATKPGTQGEVADPEDQLIVFGGLLINDVLTHIEKQLETLTVDSERLILKKLYFEIKDKYKDLQ